MYANLNQAEEAEMQAMLEREEFHDVREAVLPWSEHLRDEGRREGRREGLCIAVLDLCELLDIRLSDEQRTALSGMATAELETLRIHMPSERPS